MKIFKYPFAIANGFQLKMPEDAKVLHVGLQDSCPCIWALVNPERGDDFYHFEVYGTGHEINMFGREYLGTLLMPPFVWHVFEVGRNV